jgi:hypothetical protein
LLKLPKKTVDGWLAAPGRTWDRRRRRP